MTDIELRDLIAKDTPVPALPEIRDLMGLPLDTPLQPQKTMSEPGTSEPKSVQERYFALPLRQRIEMLWNFRYLCADAAMKARKAQ